MQSWAKSSTTTLLHPKASSIQSHPSYPPRAHACAFLAVTIFAALASPGPALVLLLTNLSSSCSRDDIAPLSSVWPGSTTWSASSSTKLNLRDTFSATDYDHFTSNANDPADSRLSDIFNSHSFHTQTAKPPRGAQSTSSSSSSSSSVSRVPQIHHCPPTATSPNAQIAHWTSTSNVAPNQSNIAPMSYYNDSDDNLSSSTTSQPLSPNPHRTSGRSNNNFHDSPELIAQYDDGRRPSAASILTATSQGSRASASRGGFRKLQGFFGEEFPGRDSSDGSFSTSVAGKSDRHRTASLSRPGPGPVPRAGSAGNHRSRNYSNASNSNTREPSPSSSRPRSPVPAPEVVPFLYQDNAVRVSSFVSMFAVGMSFPGSLSLNHNFPQLCGDKRCST